MADFSTDHYFSSCNPSISNTLFFPDAELLSCLSEMNNQFSFQDFANLSPDNRLSVSPAFPTAKCSPRFPPADEHGKLRQFSNPAIGVVYSASSSGTCSAPQDLGRGKRKRGEDENGEGDKKHRGKEVVRVRAKRGQATDSHSLAERVRRGKINERLRCLQDIVPGCYKTMGMAVMLDEIINYVQSLQNQVEFLSMKLTAASSYYDFNSEADTVEALQRNQAFGKKKSSNPNAELDDE